MLSNEQLLDYIRKAKQGDEKAKEIIYSINSPLIKSIIKRFKNKGVEYEDLYQIASIGFLKAVKNFDESYNVKFSTYTVPMIIGEIKRYIRDNGAIKVSRSLKIVANKINRYIDDYLSETGEQPSIKLLSKKFDISEEEVVMALDCSKMPISIYDKHEEDEEGQELIEKISDNSSEEGLVNKIQLFNLIDKLEERDKKIIVLRYFRDKTQNEVAEALGVSQVQVSRLENKIIQKIRLNF